MSPHDLFRLSRSGCSRAASGTPKDKEAPKKAKTPQGRFDSPEETRKDVLESEDACAPLYLTFIHHNLWYQLHSVCK